MKALLLVVLPLMLSACSSQKPTPVWTPPPASTVPIRVSSGEARPMMRLPDDVRPAAYRLSLLLHPDRDGLAGVVDIDVALERPRDVIWLHSRSPSIRRATVGMAGTAPREARVETSDPKDQDSGGIVGLRLPEAIGPGLATVHLEFESPYGKQSRGIYRVERGGDRYVFSQFEAVWARDAFPCFDEPRWKAPFDVSVVVPAKAAAIGNGREASRVPTANGLHRVTFAATPPLPTYLVAFAVGPLDIVEAPPIAASVARSRALPFRGVAARGRGSDLAYAMEHTPAILASLESYFGVEYPYDKLDIIAVPDKVGAMENAGAVTFGEPLLLLNANAAVDRRRAFAGVMAHELAHQWFGNLVTMPWWDDIWLNEAFATWMATRTLQRLSSQPNKGPSIGSPDQAEIGHLEQLYGVMNADGLSSARQIRQPVLNRNDIDNAFDGITYKKGAQVLGMFERWLGPEAFQKGVQAQMTKFRFGSARAEDLMASLTQASGRDVTAPFQSFLLQPGVPLVEVAIQCGPKNVLKLRQVRDLPVGSEADPWRTWQLPVCARYSVGREAKQACGLLTEREGELPLEGNACPAWVHPNAGASGYYRFAMPPADMQRLLRARGELSGPERMALADSIRASFARGSTPAGEVLASLEPFAADPNPSLATAPFDVLALARQWVDPSIRSAVDTTARRLYGPVYATLGWSPKGGKSDPPERWLLRREVIAMLAWAGHPEVRAEALRRGKAFVGFGKDNAIHTDAVNENLVETALAVAVQDGGEPVFDAILSKLSQADESVRLVRGDLVAALAAAKDPKLSARARELVFDPRVQANEMTIVLSVQLDQEETREAAWQWIQAHLQQLLTRLPARRAARLPTVASRFCDKEHEEQAASVFSPHLAAMEGGPRTLENTLEQIRLCSVRRRVQTPALKAYFSAHPPKKS